MNVEETSELNYQEYNHPILLFDGVCNLCNWAVDFILKHEKSTEIKFSSLQSAFSEDALSKFGKKSTDLETVFIITNGKLLSQAEVVIFIGNYLKKPWAFISFLKIFPISFLNIFYRFFAKNRYHFFGKKKSCRITTEAEKARFIE